MDKSIAVPTKYGRLEIGTFANATLRLPELNVAIKEDFAIIAKIANELIDGSATPEYVGLLAKIAKLPSSYHADLLKLLIEDANAAARSAEAIRHFEELEYQYFPKGNQLLVKNPDNEYSLLVNFIDSDRAKCSSVWRREEFVAKLPSWVSAGRVSSASDVCTVVPKQAETLKKAIRELNLPYGKVGEIIWLISHLSERRQVQLFEKLRTGFSDQELSDLTKRVRERMAETERRRKYEEAGEFAEPIFFEDTKELMLAHCYALIDLSVDPPTIRIPSLLEWERPSPVEVGRYVLKRKWSKNREMIGISSGAFVAKFWSSKWMGVPDQIEKAIPRIPEPYRTRLSGLYAELLAHALKR